MKRKVSHRANPVSTIAISSASLKMSSPMAPIKSTVTLLLLLLLTPISALCPSRCNCDESKLAVDCKDGLLDLVPITLNPSLSELYLNRNIIKSIASSFTFYRKLQLLDLSNNAITSLGSRNFQSQSILQVLFINRNKLTELKRDAFVGLSSLRILTLSENNIKFIEDRVFTPLKNLEKLDLSGNAISYTNGHTFFGLSSLKALHLQKNFLTSLPSDAIHLLRNVTHLDLSYNLIEGTLGEIPFFPFLTDLNLEGNKIMKLKNATFSNVQESLLLLNLATNLLESIPTNSLTILGHLEHLSLSRNPILHLSENCLKGLSNLKSFTLRNDDSLKSIHRKAFTSNSLLQSISIDFCPNLHKIEVETFVFQRETLRSVSLRGNGITVLTESLFDWDAIELLDIRGNPFNCSSCDILWLWKYLNKRVNLSFPEEHLREILCQEPIELRGHEVSSMSLSQMTCVIDSNGIASTFSSSFPSSSSSASSSSSFPYAPNAASNLNNGTSNWSTGNPAVPSWQQRKTSNFFVIPVSIVSAVTFAIGVAAVAWLVFRKNRQKRLAEERIKQFLTVNIHSINSGVNNNLHNSSSNFGASSSNCNTLLINKSYSGHEATAKYYSSIAPSRSNPSGSNSSSPVGTLVNPFEQMNLYESPVYHEITTCNTTSSPRHQQTVPLIASSPFNCTTYINTSPAASNSTKTSSGYTRSGSNRSASSGSTSSRNQQRIYHGSPQLYSSHESSVTTNSTSLASGNSLTVATTTPYAASFVIQHPIKVDQNLYRV